VAAHVYMLLCADGSFYVGSTTNFEQRMGEHMSGLSGYTSTCLPVTLVWSDEFQFIEDARGRAEAEGLVAREEAGADSRRLGAGEGAGPARRASFETRLRRSSG
jgi:tRNA/rRNA methyltransferase